MIYPPYFDINISYAKNPLPVYDSHSYQGVEPGYLYSQEKDFFYCNYMM